MKRTVMLVLLAVAAALLLAGGVALAQEITCGGGRCEGTAQADQIAGTAGDDEILGRGGDDTIRGNGGGDVVRGGAGHDTISVTGRDRQPDAVFGGFGDDLIGVDENNSADQVDCGPGTDTVIFDKGVDTVTNCEIKRTT